MEGAERMQGQKEKEMVPTQRREKVGQAAGLQGCGLREGGGGKLIKQVQSGNYSKEREREGEIRKYV